MCDSCIDQDVLSRLRTLLCCILRVQSYPGPWAETLRGSLCQFRINLKGCNRTGASYHLCQQGRVIARSSTDVRGAAALPQPECIHHAGHHAGLCAIELELVFEGPPDRDTGRPGRSFHDIRHGVWCAAEQSATVAGPKTPRVARRQRLRSAPLSQLRQADAIPPHNAVARAQAVS